MEQEPFNSDLTNLNVYFNLANPYGIQWIHDVSTSGTLAPGLTQLKSASGFFESRGNEHVPWLDRVLKVCCQPPELAYCDSCVGSTSCLLFPGAARGVITAVRGVRVRTGVHLISSTVCCSRSHTPPSIAFTSPRAVHGCAHSTGARKGSLLYTTYIVGLRSHNFGEGSQCSTVTFPFEANYDTNDDLLCTLPFP